MRWRGLKLIMAVGAAGACGGSQRHRARAPGPTPPAIRLPAVPPPIAPPNATDGCVPEDDVEAYTKALEAHTLATLTALAAAEQATVVTRATYYIDGDPIGSDPSVVAVVPGAPFDAQQRISVARTSDGTVRMFGSNPRHHVVEIFACDTTCNVQGGAMERPRTLVFRLDPGETLGPLLVPNADAWSVQRAQLDIQTCYGDSPPP
jgi:hypothetical protein